MNTLEKPNNIKPLITVVTICYNAVDTIEETIKSVIEQTYPNIEYIVIDGGSTDGTVDIIKKYQDKISYWVSEPDRGIYDAMNKGTMKANGRWINFMNSGDVFYNNHILEDVFSNNIDNADVIYGSVMLDKKGKEIEVRPGSFDEFWKGSRFCQQSAFISTELHKKHPYDLQYKIAADFNFFYNIYKENKVFLFVDLVVSKISLGGLSDVGRIYLFQEILKIIDKKDKNKALFHFIKAGIKGVILSRGKILTYYLFGK